MRAQTCIRQTLLICFVMTLCASVLPAEELTLPQVLAMVASTNPTVTAGRLSADAARLAARGARALANPEVFVAPSLTGHPGSDSAVLIVQPLEINGSRYMRGQIAAREADATDQDAEAIRRDLIRQASEIYWSIGCAQELVKLNQENITYLETVRAAVGKQYSVGSVPGAQVLKIDVELARARQDLSTALLTLRENKSQLSSLMGRCTTADFTVTEPAEICCISLDQARLTALALQHRPEITSAQALVSASQGYIKASRLRRVPDLVIQARRESFHTDSGVAIVVNLPLLDWGSVAAEIRKAELTAQLRDKQLEAVRNQVSLEVERAILRCNTAWKVLSEYQGGVLAHSEELAAMARKGYEMGASNYLELLEAQRTLRRVKSDYYTARTELAKAVAQLEWAVGHSITQQISEVRE